MEEGVGVARQEHLADARDTDSYVCSNAHMLTDPSWLALLGSGGVGLAIYRSIWRIVRPWEVKRLAQAKVDEDVILAKGAVDVDGIKAVGNARVARLRAAISPEVGAPPALPASPPAEIVTGEFESITFETGPTQSLDDRIRERVLYDMREEQENLDIVVETMFSLPAPSGDPEGKEPSTAWRRKFIRQVGENATDDEARKLYAKLLAGEIVSPGRFSLTTLDVLANLSAADVRLFERTIPFTIDDGVIVTAQNFWHHTSGISFDEILRLDECGLLHRNLAFIIRNGRTEPPWESTIGMLDKLLVVRRKATVQLQQNSQAWETTAHMMTQAGQELRKLNEHRADRKFLSAFQAYGDSQGYQVTVDDRPTSS